MLQANISRFERPSIAMAVFKIDIDLDNLISVNLNGVRATRHKHFDEYKSPITNYVCQFGEAVVAVIPGIRNRLENRGWHGLYPGYSKHLFGEPWHQHRLGGKTF